MTDSRQRCSATTRPKPGCRRTTRSGRSGAWWMRSSQSCRRGSKACTRGSRPSIPPEKLLRAQLLQILHTVRSERQLMEQLDYNLLFRCFVGLNMDDPVWDPTVFTKNRQRPLDGEVAMAFLERVVEQARGGLPFCDALGVPVGPSSLTT